MREVVGNLWDAEVDAIAVTTNGSVRKDGRAVMGRGCAREAAERFPTMPLRLGRLLREHGNHVLGVYKGVGRPTIFSFPVKHQWHERASLALIQRSARELLAYMDLGTWQSVALPRPGCGNGRLDWELVRPTLEEIFDDRFVVYSYPPGPAQVSNGETRGARSVDGR